MKKTFTLSGKRILLTAVALLAFVANMNAGSTYYAYYTKATAYPTGKGQIYLTEESEVPEDATYKDEVECKMVSTSAMLNLFALPAEGYQFAGVSMATPEYDETYTYITGYTFSDEIVYTGNPCYLSLASDATDNPNGDENIKSDSLAVAGMMPLEPNNVFYALFTKVTVEVAENQSSLGSVSISKVCNDKGDEVTLTATPGEGSTFEGWTLNDETVSTNAEYTITVGDETATYVAHFSNPNLITLHFEDWGSSLPWYDDANDLMLGESVWAYTFYSDSTRIAGTDGAQSYSTPLEGSYQVAAQNPKVLWGYGDVQVLKVAADPEYIYPDYDSMNRWSGEKGVSTDTLDNTYAYYTVDIDNQQINLATTIPANQVYVALPESVYKQAGLTAAPAIIYTTVWAVPEGVETIKMNTTGMGTIYALDGKQVVAPQQRGIYIKNGKKVVIKK